MYLLSIHRVDPLKMFCAQGYTDNSGLGPILAEYLKNTSTKGHVTVLIANQLGDHQMETYFESTPNDGGMICKDGEGMEEQFNKIKEIHQRSFQDVGGEFIPRDGEKVCSIRLASAVFFKVVILGTRSGLGLVLEVQGVLGINRSW